jgi:molybdenum cofactor biosynthesis enzyme
MQLKDKLAKIGDSLTVNLYDNGYMVDVSGKNEEDDWANARVMISSVEELLEIITEATEMERDD